MHLGRGTPETRTLQEAGLLADRFRHCDCCRGGQASARGTAGKPPPVPMSSSECGASVHQQGCERVADVRGQDMFRICVRSQVHDFVGFGEQCQKRRQPRAEGVAAYCRPLLAGSAREKSSIDWRTRGSKLCHTASSSVVIQILQSLFHVEQLRQSEPLRQNALDDADRRKEDDHHMPPRRPAKWTRWP